MKIVVTGGGSGGHITPILAVAHELKQLQPDCSISYIGQRGDGLADIVQRSPDIAAIHAVSAGKFRRYHGEGLRQILDIKTMALNVRDLFRVITGFGQSLRLLRRLRPDVLFIKGGFVGAPVGLAAALLKIPFITHDSDAIPGLANRIIGRWAMAHAVALPKEVYRYPATKTVTVGVPVTADYTLVTEKLKAQYRQELGIATDAQLLFIIGGGLGAQRINAAVMAAAPQLLSNLPNLQIVHGVGRANEAQMQQAYGSLLSTADAARVTVVGFLHDVYRYSGAADVVVTRAGATNLAEFAVQGKACVVIPSPFLTGGHQLKNANFLREQQAAELVDEADLQARPEVLPNILLSLLADAPRQAALGRRFTAFGHPRAAQELAELIVSKAAQ